MLCGSAESDVAVLPSQDLRKTVTLVHSTKNKKWRKPKSGEFHFGFTSEMAMLRACAFGDADEF